MKVLAKHKKKARLRKTAQTVNETYLLVQQRLVPVALEEYMLREWFKTVEEEEDKEEVLYFCKTIVIDIDFQEHNIHIMHDNRTRSHNIVPIVPNKTK